MPTLNWLTRKDDIKASGQVPYRILEPAAKGVYGDPGSGSLLIQGDNLDALKSLLPFYAGSVKCIFIDPPYNTRKDFEHYQDNLEHAQWLEMMYPRLELLRKLLADNGSIWAIIDDDEGHYLKVLMDEIFGRKNFIANVVWQKFHSVKTNARHNISQSHDHILAYSKNKNLLTDFNLLDMDEEALKVYKNPDNDPRGPWRTAPLTVSLLTGQRGVSYAKTGVSSGIYEITAPNGKRHLPNEGRCWISKKTVNELIKDNRIWWGRKGDAVPMKKLFLLEKGSKKTCSTFWIHTEAGSNKKAKEEMKLLLPNQAFSTPKPELLLQRVLSLATQPNDLVLDSFLGSGTTAAVAHKMNRRWIGIEMGEHAHTHCIPRLEKVIAGEQGGISKAVNWQGGGGFRFLRLGETIFLPGGYINPQVTFAGLAAHLWFAETRTPFDGADQSPFLGVHDHTGYALLYNGILRDKTANGGNVLTAATLDAIRRGAPNGFNGPVVVYANGCRFGKARMRAENLECKQLPYDCEQR